MLTTVSSRLALALVVALGTSAAGCGKKKDKDPAPTEVVKVGGGTGTAAGTGAGTAAGTGAGTAAGTGSGTAAVAPTTPVITVAASIADAVAAADRPADDKALDAGRKPVEMLTFLHVTAGMKVAEIFAGGGGTVELLARVVGPTGVVYGQNTKEVLEKFAEKPWSARLARLASPSIIRVDRDLSSPLPPEAKDLDLVVMHLVYHDTVWLGADRTGMNGAIWAALKPGGEFAVIDHSAKDGTGADAAKDLHRIERSFVQNEIEATGFKLDRESDLFKHPEDTRDWSASPAVAGAQRGQSDRFFLVFKKPVDAK